MAERTLFARKATGLVREVGFVTAVILAIANVVGLGWQKRVFQALGRESVLPSEYFLGIHPMLMAFAVMGGLMLLSIYTFAVLSAAMPRSGGGYVFLSRIVSPGFAFVVTCLEFFAICVAYGQIAVATFEGTLIFGGLGGLTFVYNYAYPIYMTIIGIVIIAIFSAIACLGARMTGYLLHIIFWVPAAVLVMVYLLFLTGSATTMESGIALFTGSPSVDFTNAAIAQGLASSGSYFSAFFGACIFAYWAYIGFAAATFVGGEVKEASKSLPRAMFTSGIIITLIYLTINFLLIRIATSVGQAGGFSFLEGLAYLDIRGDFAAAGLSNPGAWMTTIPGLLAYGQFGMAGGRAMGLVLIAFAALWIANDIPPFILACSRMMFAMGFDRILPEWVADVNEKWASPVNAIIVTSVAALVGVFAEANLFSPRAPSFLQGGLGIGLLHAPGGIDFINSGGAVTATTLWDVMFFAAVGLACALFPSRMPEVFERAPWRHSRGVVVGLGWLAFALNAIFVLLIVFHETGLAFGPAFSLPIMGGFGGNWASGGFWFTLILAGIATLVYFWGRSRAQREGADLTTIFAEIPPE
jgi:APA family basic amino acid/polyamine antiporter